VTCGPFLGVEADEEIGCSLSGHLRELAALIRRFRRHPSVSLGDLASDIPLGLGVEVRLQHLPDQLSFCARGASVAWCVKMVPSEPVTP